MNLFNLIYVFNLFPRLQPGCSLKSVLVEIVAFEYEATIGTF